MWISTGKEASSVDWIKFFGAHFAIAACINAISFAVAAIVYYRKK
jgi:hypothetical protein